MITQFQEKYRWFLRGFFDKLLNENLGTKFFLTGQFLKFLDFHLALGI